MVNITDRRKQERQMLPSGVIIGGYRVEVEATRETLLLSSNSAGRNKNDTHQIRMPYLYLKKSDMGPQ